MKGLQEAYKTVFGTEGIKVRDFVKSTLTSIPFLVQEGDADDEQTSVLSSEKLVFEKGETMTAAGMQQGAVGASINDKKSQIAIKNGDSRRNEIGGSDQNVGDRFSSHIAKQEDLNKGIKEGEEDKQGDPVSDVVQAVGQALASTGVKTAIVPFLERGTLQANREATKHLGLEFQRKAKAEYVESELARPEEQDKKSSPRATVKVSILIVPI